MKHENLIISIITPTFNCAQYITTTVNSVLHQNYPHYEHIVIDGGSTDGTLDIINSYPHLRIISEPDKGQYDAINKGVRMANGDILCWLNGDDFYFPWTLQVVATVFSRFPDIEWISSLFPTHGNQYDAVVHTYPVHGFHRKALSKPVSLKSKSFPGMIQQESTFWRKSLWDQAGELDLSFSYAADYELWYRFYQYTTLFGVSTPLACFRWVNEQKSRKFFDQYILDLETIYQKHHITPVGLFSSLFRKYLPTLNGLPQKLLKLLPGTKLSQNIIFDRHANDWCLKKQYFYSR
jgi:glycosyltransferase involved in cell wall biosynthesis